MQTADATELRRVCPGRIVVSDCSLLDFETRAMLTIELLSWLAGMVGVGTEGRVRLLHRAQLHEKGLTAIDSARVYRPARLADALL